MLERATDDMLLELQQADLHMESYLEENRDGFVHQNVGQYLTELVESRGKTGGCHQSRGYSHQLCLRDFRGAEIPCPG